MAITAPRDAAKTAPPRPPPAKGASDAALVPALQRLRQLCGEVINHPKVQLAIILLICINAIMMGIATFDFVMDDPEIARAFDIMDEVFLYIFTLELVMQFMFMGFDIFRDGWLVLTSSSSCCPGRSPACRWSPSRSSGPSGSSGPSALSRG